VAVESTWCVSVLRGCTVLEIDAIKWEDGRGLEELNIWGVLFIQALAEAILKIIDNSENDNGHIIYFALLIKEATVDVENCIFRFLSEVKGREVQ
jgi:hypothetical protein